MEPSSWRFPLWLSLDTFRVNGERDVRVSSGIWLLLFGRLITSRKGPSSSQDCFGICVDLFSLSVVVHPDQEHIREERVEFCLKVPERILPIMMGRTWLLQGHEAQLSVRKQTGHTSSAQGGRKTESRKWSQPLVIHLQQQSSIS